MRNRIATHFGISFIFALGAGSSFANPTGGSVVGGSATISGEGTSLTTINQSSHNAIINWTDFSIGAGEITHFVQPSSTASILNRVTSGDPSLIYGSLQGNGHVFVINPNGILVGSGGVINTKGFVASTLDVPNATFMSGHNLIFSGNSDASIQNQGNIQALGGNVFLIAHSVDNSGAILAPQGTVGLAAGSQVQLVQAGSDHISVIAGNSSIPTASVGVNNMGTIEAASAELKAAGGNIYALAINNGGVVRANGLVNHGGHIYLGATGGNIQNSGTLSANNANGSGGTVVLDGGHNASTPATVVNSGTIEATGNSPGAKGGKVEVLGDNVTLQGTAEVNVSGNGGGGTALIGGDTQGENASIQNAQHIIVQAGATINADATQGGNGGKVVVWSDDSTTFGGEISARGGVSGGNGGSAEISSKQDLSITGHADLTAPHGAAGGLLLDPGSVDIVSGANTAPPATMDTFNDGWVNAQLGLGNLTISTANANNANAEDLTVDAGAAISWNSAFSLTLVGNNSITVNGTIANAGSGGLSLSSGGAIAINNNITAGSVLVHSTIASGAGISFGSGVTVRSDNQTYWAGNGTGSATADLITQTPAFLNQAGTATPSSFALRQDGTIGDANLPALAQFGPTAAHAAPTAYTIESDHGTVTISTAAKVAGSALTLDASQTLSIDATLNGANSLASLSATGNGIALNSAGIQSSAGQTYNGAVTLGGNVTVSGVGVDFAGTIAGTGDALTVNAGSGALTLGGNVGGGGALGALTLNSSGATTLGGTVNAASLVTDAGGTTAINGGAVTTTTSQTYGDSLSLGADTTLSGTTLALAGVAGNNNSLTLGNGGTATLGGAVSGVKVLTANAGTGTLAVNSTVAANKVVDNQATTLSGVSVTTTAGNSQDGSQTYNGSVTLGGNVTVSGVGVDFAGTIAGTGDALTVNAGSGALTLGGNVGAGGALGAIALNSSGATTIGGTVNAASLATDAGGTTAINGGTVTTTAGQTYGDAVSLGADTTLSGTTLALAGVTGNNNSLTLGNSGAATLGGAVSGVKVLTANAGTGTLAVNSTVAANKVVDNQATTLSGVSVTTTAGNSQDGSQTYNGSVTLGGNVTVSGVGVDFAGTIAGTGDALTVNAGSGALTLGGNVGAGGALGALTLNSSGATTIGGTIDAASLTTDAAGSLALNAKVQANSVNLNGTTITLNAAGTTASPTIQTTGGGQTYGGAVAMSADTVLEDTSGGSIAFNSTVNGAHNLQVNTAGTTTFGGVVGGTTALTSLETDDASAAAGSKGGNTLVDANVTTTAGQTYNDRVVTASGITLKGSTMTFNNILSPGDDANAASLSINGNLTFGPASTYFVTLNGTTAGSQFDQITVNAASTVTITSGADITASENHSFNVGNALRVINNNGTLSGTFLSSQLNIDGQQFTVSYTGNDTILTRSVSSWFWDATGANENWNVNNNWVDSANHHGQPGDGDTVTFGGITDLNPINNISGLTLNQIIFQTGSGAFTLGGNAVSLTGGILNNSASLQTINMPITLAADQTFGALSGSLAFGALGTIQGPFTLTLSGPSSITLGGAVGGAGSPLTALIANTPLTISGGAINTVGAQTYNSAVTLGNSTTFATTGSGVVTFGSTVDGTTVGAQDLTVDGDVSFGGALGGSVSLANVSVVSPDAVLLNQNIAANSVSVHSGTSGTGNTTFGSGVTVQADTQSYQAGDGSGGAGTAALVDLVANNPSFRNSAGSAAPLSFTYQQDASIAAGNVPVSSQFGGTLPGSLSIQSFDGAVALPGMTLPGSLQVSALGAISQSGALIVSGLGSFTSSGTGANGDITLNVAANSFGSLALSSANGTAASVNAAGDTTLDAVSLNGGSLTVNSGGAISQVAGRTVTVGGVASFTSTGSGASGNITLNNSGNSFGSLGLNSANGLAVSATTAGAAVLNTVSVTPGGSGTFSITSGGGITQVAGTTVSVGGAATFTAPGGSSISLVNAGNLFGSSVSFAGNGGNLLNVSLFDSVGFTIQGLTINGALDLVSGGAINQSGTLNIGGLASFTSTGGGANGDITLNDSGNVFGSLGLISANGSAVSAAVSVATVLDNVSVNPLGGGTLALTSGGGISQVAGKTIGVGGAANFTAPAGDSIALGNAGNAFNGPVTFAGIAGNLQNVTVASSSAFDIGGLTLGGNLDVNSGGAVTQTGAIVANGLQVTAAGPVTLNNPGNQVNSVGGTVTGSGKSFAFTDQGTAMNVAGITTDNGNITLTSDSMTLSGPVNSGSGDTLLQPFTSGLDINMGSLVAGDLSLTQSDINQVRAKILQIGNTLVGTIFNKNTVSISGLPIVTLLYIDHTTTTEASSQAFAQLLAGAILPVPKANVTGFTGVSIDAEEAAKILPPGSIGVLFLQIPFPPSLEAKSRIEDITKWTGGHVAAVAPKSGSQPSN